MIERFFAAAVAVLLALLVIYIIGTSTLMVYGSRL